MGTHSLIVIGEVNTDIIVNGLPRFPKKGELINGKTLSIGPGGKSRNIAAMAGILMPKNSVAMVSKTTKDPYGLWEIPVTALEQAGVNTRYVAVSTHTDQSPGFALILVDQQGNNQIIGAPGITRNFLPEDIDAASTLFNEVGNNNGLMAFIGNCPIETAKYAIEKATTTGVRVVFDPGGADDTKNLEQLLDEKIFLFKPNEHEAEVLSGIPISGFESAKQAAKVFQSRGVKNILITAGAQGAYLFSDTIEQHIPIPSLSKSKIKDETGCGDQVLAALCARLLGGESLENAVRSAVLAGTLQFHKAGIQPVTLKEIEENQ